MAKKFFKSVFGKDVIIPPDIHELDIKTNRNEKMVKLLMQPNVNGMFLFYLQGNGIMMTHGFAMPPGLQPEEAKEFQEEFKRLFERYAQKATHNLGI